MICGPTDKVLPFNLPRYRSGFMERTLVTWLGFSLSERFSFLIKAAIFLSICGATLFVALASSYPAVHDSLHNVRHALAIVPCH